MGVLMAFAINQPKSVCKWVDFLNEKNEKEGELKIKGIRNEQYQVELDRTNRIYANGDHIKYEGSPLTQNQAIFLLVATHLLVDWKNVFFEQDGEVVEVPFSIENAFNLMRWGVGFSGAGFAGFVIGKSTAIQEEADNYKAEVMGKSLNSTDGQKSEAAKKRTSKTK